MKTTNINGKDFTIEELNKLLEKSKTENIEKEKLFLELFQGLEIRSDIENYPDSVFYYRGENCYLEIKNNNLYVNYAAIWKKLIDKFNMKDNEIQSFIKSMVEKHFKCNFLNIAPEVQLSIIW